MKVSTKRRLYRVGTFVHPRGGKKALIMAYLRDFSPQWQGCVVYDVEASSGKEAKWLACGLRRRSEQ